MWRLVVVTHCTRPGISGGLAILQLPSLVSLYFFYFADTVEYGGCESLQPSRRIFFLFVPLSPAAERSPDDQSSAALLHLTTHRNR